MIRILVIDPEKHAGTRLAKILETEGMVPSLALEREQALSQLDREFPDAVVLSLGPTGSRRE